MNFTFPITKVSRRSALISTDSLDPKMTSTPIPNMLCNNS